MFDKKHIEQLSKQLQKPVKNISHEGLNTIIEFEDGDIIPLYGGGGIPIEGIKNPVFYCSFCGVEGTKDFPVVQLNDKSKSCICSKCSINAIETFVENGIEIELDLTNLVSNELIEKMLDKDKD